MLIPSLLKAGQGAMRGKRDKSKKFPTNWKQEKKKRKDLATSQQPHTNLASSSPSIGVRDVVLFIGIKPGKKLDVISNPITGLSGAQHRTDI